MTKISQRKPRRKSSFSAIIHSWSLDTVYSPSIFAVERGLNGSTPISLAHKNGKKWNSKNKNKQYDSDLNVKNYIDPGKINVAAFCLHYTLPSQPVSLSCFCTKCLIIESSHTYFQEHAGIQENVHCGEDLCSENRCNVQTSPKNDYVVRTPLQCQAADYKWFQ